MKNWLAKYDTGGPGDPLKTLYDKYSKMYPGLKYGQMSDIPFKTGSNNDNPQYETNNTRNCIYGLECIPHEGRAAFNADLRKAFPKASTKWGAPDHMTSQQDIDKFLQSEKKTYSNIYVDSYGNVAMPFKTKQPYFQEIKEEPVPQVIEQTNAPSIPSSDFDLSWEQIQEKYKDYGVLEPVYELTNRGNQEGYGNQKIVGIRYRDYYDPDRPWLFQPAEIRFKRKKGGPVNRLNKYDTGGPGPKKPPMAKIIDEKGQTKSIPIASQEYANLYPYLMPYNSVTQMGTGFLPKIKVEGKRPGFFQRAWDSFESSNFNPVNLGKKVIYPDFAHDFGDDNISYDQAWEIARGKGMPEFFYNGKKYDTSLSYLTPQEQLETTGITDDQLHFRTKFEDNLSRNLDPFGYFDMTSRVWDAGMMDKKHESRIENEKAISDDPNLSHRFDAFNLYTGKPQEHNTFSVSQYKPTRAKNENDIYYSINSISTNKDYKKEMVDIYNGISSKVNKVISQQGLSPKNVEDIKNKYFYSTDPTEKDEFQNILNYLNGKIENDHTKKVGEEFLKDLGINDFRSLDPEKQKDIAHFIFSIDAYDPSTGSVYRKDNQNAIMGKYNLSKGKDPDGREYISYSDKWDIKPYDFGKAFNIYDRIYLDDPDLKKLGGSAKWLDRYDNGGPGKPKTIKVDFGQGSPYGAGVQEISTDSPEYRYIYPNLMSKGLDPTSGEVLHYGTPMDAITFTPEDSEFYENAENSANTYNPLFFKEGITPTLGPIEAAIAAATLGPVALSTASAAAPYVSSALSAPLTVGSTTIPGATLGNYFIGQGLYNSTKNLIGPAFGIKSPLYDSWQNFSNNPTGSGFAGALGETGMTAFGLYGPNWRGGFSGLGDDLTQGGKFISSKFKGTPGGHSYFRDLGYSLRQGKLPTYRNVMRWQPDEVPEGLKWHGQFLTPEQQGLTGSWYTYKPEEQLGFYMQTRPGAGNVNVLRMSDRQIAELENSMSGAARGMSGKGESVANSNHFLSGELSVPLNIRNRARPFRFDVNPIEYAVPNNTDPASTWGRLLAGDHAVNVVNSNYNNIFGIPRKYFPFRDGGSANWLYRYDAGGSRCPDGFYWDVALKTCVKNNTGVAHKLSYLIDNNPVNFKKEEPVIKLDIPLKPIDARSTVQMKPQHNVNIPDTMLSWEQIQEKYKDYAPSSAIYQMTNKGSTEEYGEGYGNQKIVGFNYRDYYDKDNPRRFRPAEFRFKQKTGGATNWLDRYDVGGTSDCPPGYVKTWTGICVPVVPTSLVNPLGVNKTNTKTVVDNKPKKPVKPEGLDFATDIDISAPASTTYVAPTTPIPTELEMQESFAIAQDAEKIKKERKKYGQTITDKEAQEEAKRLRYYNPGTIRAATDEQTAELMSEGPSYATQVRSDKKAKPLIENNPQGDRTNQEWLASFKPEDQETLKYSTYASMFEPELWKQSLQGLESLGRWTLNNSPVGLTYRAVVDPLGLNNTNLINTPFYTAPGYTEETARGVSPLQTLSVLGYPQRAVQGMLTGSSLLNPQPYLTYNNYGGSDINTMNIAASLASDPLMIPEVGAMPFRLLGKGLSLGADLGRAGFNAFKNSRMVTPKLPKLTPFIPEMPRVEMPTFEPPRFDLNTPAQNFSSHDDFLQALDEFYTSENIPTASAPPHVIQNFETNLANYLRTTFPELNISAGDLRTSLEALDPADAQRVYSALYDKATDLTGNGLFSVDDINAIRSYTPPPYVPPVRNVSGFTRENLLNAANKESAAKFANMTDDELKNSVLKINGDIEFKDAIGNSLDNVVQIPEQDYISYFNDNVADLNNKIKLKNKSGIDYYVKGLEPQFLGHFDTGFYNLVIEVPEQTKIIDGVETFIPATTRKWSITVKPGLFADEVKNINNRNYFQSIPGIEMNVTSSGIFPGSLKGRRGSGMYESLNEFLKENALGRVKPGFNSQTTNQVMPDGRVITGSKDVWESFINRGKAYGYYGNPGTVYGIMKRKGGALSEYPKGGPIDNVPTVRVVDEKGKTTTMRIDDPKYKGLYPHMRPYNAETKTMTDYIMEPLVIYSKENKPKEKKPSFFERLERKIDKFLGNPQQKARDLSNFGDGEEDPVDNVRHPGAAMYTTEALGSSLPAAIAANLLGIAHEAYVLPETIKHDGWYHGLRSTGEDLINNAVGSGIGMLPETFFPTKAKEELIWQLSQNNMLPDGVSSKRGDMYWKKKKGGVKTSAEGYYDYINGYEGVSLSKGGPSKKGWLEKYK